MQRYLKSLAVTAVGALLVGGLAYAADQDRDRLQTRDRDQLQTPNQARHRDICGYRLMTQQERDEYRARMRAATTPEEREQIRAEHHAQMQARAKERGLTLPEQPPMGGPEMRRGPGMGGPAPGGGMGGGRRY